MSTIRNLVDSVRPDGCSPGAPKDLGIGEVLLGAGALRELPGVVSRVMESAGVPTSTPRTVVLCDTNTRAAAGDLVAELLRGAGLQVSIQEWKTDSGDLIPHEKTIGEGLTGVPPDTQLMVSVGSGVVTDSARYVAFRIGLPFINVPTAPSVDGFTSSVSPLILAGIKVTVPAKSPSAVVADVDILQNAPTRLKSAGFGDFIGKLTARVDWLLSHVVTGEAYCDYIVDAVTEQVARVVAAPKDRADFPEQLFEGLIVSGIGMTLVDSSRPASGSEHHISHFFELKALRHLLPHYYHGETVGLGTFLVSGLYYAVLDDRTRLRDRAKAAAAKWFDAASRKRLIEERCALLERAFGPIAPTMQESYRAHAPTPEAARNLAERVEATLDAVEPVTRTHLPTPVRLRELFDEAGLRYRFSELKISRETVVEAIVCAKEIRDRFTVLSLLDGLGVIEQYAEDVVQELYD